MGISGAAAMTTSRWRAGDIIPDRHVNVLPGPRAYPRTASAGIAPVLTRTASARLRDIPVVTQSINNALLYSEAGQATDRLITAEARSCYVQFGRRCPVMRQRRFQ